MDLLNAVLPTNPPPMALTVNGRPIADVLTVVANALRAQQEEMNAFKAFHRAESDVVNRRLGTLEEKVARIERDLNITARPFGARGQLPQPTAYQAITKMEYRIYRAERVGRRQVHDVVLDAYEKATLQRYFAIWARHRALRAAVMMMMGRSLMPVQLRAFLRWKHNVQEFKAQLRARRLVRSTLFVTAKSLAAVYFRKWLMWHVDLQNRLAEKRARDSAVAERLSTFLLRGTARRYFNKWAQYREHIAYNLRRWREAQRLEVLNHRVLAANAFEKWQEFTNFRLFAVRRNRAIATRHKQALRALVLRYLYTWQRFVAVQQGRHAKLLLVNRMHHAAMMRLAHRYFEKVVRYVQYVKQHRRFEELAAYLTLLARKYDALGEQLDLGLDNLSHTNGVLSRVVDTILLTNPEVPQVQHLLSVHRGDRALHARVPDRDDLRRVAAVDATYGGASGAGGGASPAAAGRGGAAADDAVPESRSYALPARHQADPQPPQQPRRTNSSAGSGGPSAGRHRTAYLSPGTSRENPENRVMSVRDLISRQEEFEGRR